VSRAPVVHGEGELLIVAAGPEPSPRLTEELVPLLAGRFRVVEAGAEPGRIADLIADLAPERWAAIGIGEGAGAALTAALDVRGLEALVLVSPLGLDGALHRRDELAAMEPPVLILGGEEDPLVPVAAMERLTEAMPSSTLGLLPSCGHELLDEALDTIGPMMLEYLRARYLHAPHGHADTSGVVALQLERRAPWVDLAEYEEDDPEPTTPDPTEQEVGPSA